MKNRVILAAMAVLLVCGMVVITGCENPAGSTTTYTVTVQSDGTGATGDKNYKAGANVTIDAGTAPAGKEFKNWTTESEGVDFTDANSAKTTFKMPANDVTVTAVFGTITYAVTVESGGAGATGAGNYEQGAAVSIYAGTPPAGKEFDNWTSDSDGVQLADAENMTTSFTMPANAVTVTANFRDVVLQPDEYAITYAADPVLGGSIGGTMPAKAKENDTVSFTVTANTGYEVASVSWKTLAGSPNTITASGGVYSFTMPAEAAAVTASFTQVSYNVTYVADPTTGGSIGGTKPATAHYGDTVSFTVSANAGYSITGVSWKTAAGSANTITASGGVYSFTMPAEDVTVTAAFGDALTIFGNYILQIKSNWTKNLRMTGLTLESGAQYRFSVWSQGNVPVVLSIGNFSGAGAWGNPWIPNDTSWTYYEFDFTSTGGTYLDINPPEGYSDNGPMYWDNLALYKLDASGNPTGENVLNGDCDFEQGVAIGQPSGNYGGWNAPNNDTDENFAVVQYSKAVYGPPPALWFTRQSADMEIPQNGTGSLKVATDSLAGGTPAYAWSKSTNSDMSGSTVTDGNSTTLTLDCTAPGAFYYQCAATLSGNTIESRIISVDIIPLYNITVDSYSNGSVSLAVGSGTPIKDNFASPVPAYRGDTVIVTLTADTDYIIGGITVTDAALHDVGIMPMAIGVYQFVMPDSAVTVIPVFSEVPMDNFSIAVNYQQSGYGDAAVTLTPNVSEAKAGTQIAINIIEDITSSETSDYKLDSFSIEGDVHGDFTSQVPQNPDGTYTFIMPAENVTITAAFVEVEKGFVKRQVLYGYERTESLTYQSSYYGATHLVTIMYKTTSDDALRIGAPNIWWTAGQYYNIEPVGDAKGVYVGDDSLDGWYSGIVLPNTNGEWVTEQYRIDALHFDQGPNSMMIEFSGEGWIGYLKSQEEKDGSGNGDNHVNFDIDFSDFSKFTDVLDDAWNSGDDPVDGPVIMWAPPVPTDY
ncbi:MAG: hypothetical protein FWF29_01430 [Treponema sp.]|nr:hypothetical protein [Treponema sp.]